MHKTTFSHSGGTAGVCDYFSVILVKINNLSGFLSKAYVVY